jgi:hypothetical protein
VGRNNCSRRLLIPPSRRAKATLLPTSPTSLDALTGRLQFMMRCAVLSVTCVTSCQRYVMESLTWLLLRVEFPVT